MSLFDDDIKPRGQSPKTAEDCDIFEPSIYTPEQSKYRADYIKSITAKITAELDALLLAQEAPEGEQPSFELEVTGKDPQKHLKFTVKYLRGPRGFNGGLTNFVVLSESEYARLAVKDPNIFYFTYEGSETPGYVEDEILITSDVVDNSILITNGNVDNNILTI